MSAAQYLPPADRTRAILEDLEAVRENLLAFSDDIWAGIDRKGVDQGLFVECNLSANGIRDMLRRLVAAFEIAPDQLRLFLRQDREAGREQANG
jgi:hypothetical protein